MIDNMKTWIVEVAIKNVGPKVVSSLISMGLVFLAAHQDLMEQMGVTYYPDFNGKWSGAMPTGQLITVEISTLKVWGALALGSGVMALVALFMHHGTAAVTGKPQSGDKRDALTPALAGGERSSDPKETK